MARASWAVAALVVAACAGDLEQPERFADCPPGYVEQLFTTSCGPDCHNATDHKGELDLVSPGVADRVRGATSTTMECGGRALIDAEGGLMIEKLGAPRCGSRMPFGVPALSAADVECVRRWVDEVAP